MPDRYIRRWCEEPDCQAFSTSPYRNQRERAAVAEMFRRQGPWRCPLHSASETAATDA